MKDNITSVLALLSTHAQHFFNMNHANSPLSRGDHFVSKDLKSFIYARLAS